MRVGAIIGLISLALGLGVGAVIWANMDDNLQDQKPKYNATEMPHAVVINATVDKVVNNTWSAFDLSTITPIIMGASLVLGALSWLGTRQG